MAVCVSNQWMSTIRGDMPHIIVKLYPGRPREVLDRLAEKIAVDVMEIAGCERKAVSVVLEEVP